MWDLFHVNLENDLQGKDIIKVLQDAVVILIIAVFILLFGIIFLAFILMRTLKYYWQLHFAKPPPLGKYSPFLKSFTVRFG